MNRSRLRLIAALLVGLAAPLAAQVGYSPPTLSHWCVIPTFDEAGTARYEPGTIDLSALPKAFDPVSIHDPDWQYRRYGKGWRRGALGLHSPDYYAALVDVYGGEPTVVEVKDAYCVRDQLLLDRGVVVRIAGNESTPFAPGLWRLGRRGWDLAAWETFLEWNARAIRMSMGAAAEPYMAAVRAQLELAKRACAGGGGPAADPAAGAWAADRAGRCVASAWTRPGRLDGRWSLEVGDPGSQIAIAPRN